MIKVQMFAMLNCSTCGECGGVCGERREQTWTCPRCLTVSCDECQRARLKRPPQLNGTTPFYCMRCGFTGTTEW